MKKRTKSLGPANDGNLIVLVELTAIEVLGTTSELGGFKLPAHAAHNAMGVVDCFLCGWVGHATRCAAWAPRGPMEEAGWLAREISTEKDPMA